MTDRDPLGAGASPPPGPSPDRSSSVPPASRSAGPAEEDPKRVLPELVRRIVEAGIERLAEGPENVRQRLGDIKLPKEAIASLVAQLDEGKSGLYRVLARELRDFLESTNFTEELVRALTMLSFEIKTEIRLIPNDAGKPRPNVKSNVRVRHGDGKPSASAPPEPDPTNDPGRKHA